jgi:hypothetical protein
MPNGTSCATPYYEMDLPTDNDNVHSVTVAIQGIGIGRYVAFPCVYAVYDHKNGFYNSGGTQTTTANSAGSIMYTEVNLNAAKITQPANADAYVSCGVPTGAQIMRVTYTP